MIHLQALFSRILQILIYRLIKILLLFSDFPCFFFLDPCVFQYILFNIQIFQDSQDYFVIDNLFNSVVILEQTSYFNFFKAVDNCLIVQHIVYLRECSFYFKKNTYSGQCLDEYCTNDTQVKLVYLFFYVYQPNIQAYIYFLNLFQ